MALSMNIAILTNLAGAKPGNFAKRYPSHPEGYPSYHLGVRDGHTGNLE
jgi:hypothetical protein